MQLRDRDCEGVDVRGARLLLSRGEGMSAEDAGLKWLRWEIDKAEANIRWLETTEAALGREMDPPPVRV